MLAIEKIVAVEAKFDAPRIGMCANVIDMTRSQVDTNFRGCLHDSGRGYLSRPKGCSGAGASHGGVGG